MFYVDPPYLGTEKFYDNSFTLEDHIRLRDQLKIIKGKFILSYNDDEQIKELYKNFTIEEIQAETEAELIIPEDLKAYQCTNAL